MSNRFTNKGQRFAKNWKLVGMPSKSDWHGSRLNNRILSKSISRLVDKFQAQTVPIIEDTCYELGKEDAKQLKETLKVKDDGAKSCLQPIEMICLLNGLEAETTSEKRNTATLKVSECPFKDVLVGVIPNILMCKNYFRGMAQAVNRNATLLQPVKKCQEEGHCEFVITVSV